MDPEVSALTASFKPDTVLQSLVDLTSGATLLKAGRSVSVVCVSARTVRYCVTNYCRVDLISGGSG